MKSWSIAVMVALAVSGAMAAGQRVPDVVAGEACERMARDLREALDAVKLPPSSLQRLVDQNADRWADLTHAQLEEVFTRHKPELFGEPGDLKRFGLLREWCEAVKKDPRGRELLPMIWKEMETRQALDRKPVGWNEIAILGEGWQLGPLMDCVIGLSGVEGFQKLLDAIVAADDLPRLKVLLNRMGRLPGQKDCDALLRAKLGAFKSAALKAEAERYLKDQEAEE